MDHSMEEESAIELPNIRLEPRLFPVALFGYQHAIKLQSDVKFSDIVRNYDSLERYCDAPNETSYNVVFSCDIDLSMEEALHFPRKIAYRLPLITQTLKHCAQARIYYKLLLKTQNVSIVHCILAHSQIQMELGYQKMISDSGLKSVWCRQLSFYLEWVAGIPELRFMSNVDKLHLVTRQICRVICFTMSYKTYKMGMEKGLNFGSGWYYKPDEYCEPTTRDYAHSISDVLQRLVVSKIRKLAMTREEFLIVKLVLLFSNTETILLSEAGRNIVEGAFRKYCNALFELCREENETETHLAIRERIADTLHFLPQMELVSEEDDRLLREMTIRNKDHFNGRLIADVHLFAQ